jgi:preprotein translocase subunit YajC
MLDAVFAQAAPAVADTPSAMDQMIHMVLLLGVTVGIVYFMIIRPQQKKQKETEAMRSSIKKGDRVLTTGGLYGTVIGEKEKEGIVVLKVADDVKLEFSRESIIQVKERSG